MKEAPSAKKDKFGFLTGTLKVLDGQLVDRESGKRRRLGPGLEGRDVLVVDQEYLNDLVARGQGAAIG